MRKIKVQPLATESFLKYGTFKSMLSPEGPNFDDGVTQFYRDNITAPFSGSNLLAVSPLHIKKRPCVIEKTEIHSHTAECLVPMDGDIIIHAGPAAPNGEVPLDEFEAFLVPKGTAVTLLPGVFHYAPYACSGEEVTVLIMLPQRTYANDCVVYELAEADKITIEA